MTGPIATHRIGNPAPLAFHLSAASAMYQQAILSTQATGKHEFPMQSDMPPSPSQDAITQDVSQRLSSMMHGIEVWHRHPARRNMLEPPVIWQSGSCRLLDYGMGAARNAPVVLVVPSLINRAYILDLDEEFSVMLYLASAGLRPVLLDWGRPEFSETTFDLDRYITARLLPAASFLHGLSGKPPAVVGYCMGGSLSVALATRFPEIPALIAIGAPWDFADSTGLAGDVRTLLRMAKTPQLREFLLNLTTTFGLVPAAVFQQLFALINPVQVTLKFQAFAKLDPDSPQARKFVILEDWLADAVPMSGPAAQNLLIDWHLENATGLGTWECLGSAVRPSDIKCPSMVIAGRRDMISPPPNDPAPCRGIARCHVD